MQNTFKVLVKSWWAKRLKGKAEKMHMRLYLLTATHCYSCCPQLNPKPHPTTVLPPCSVSASTAAMKSQRCLWLSCIQQQRFFPSHSFFSQITTDLKPAFKYEPRAKANLRQLFLKHLQSFTGLLWTFRNLCNTKHSRLLFSAFLLTTLNMWVWSTFFLKSLHDSTSKHSYLI